MTTRMQNAFEAIGAEVQVDSGGDVFEIDVLRDGDREVYRLTYPLGDMITAEVLDVKPKAAAPCAGCVWLAAIGRRALPVRS